MKRVILIGGVVFVIAMTIGAGARLALTPSKPKGGAAADSTATLGEAEAALAGMAGDSGTAEAGRPGAGTPGTGEAGPGAAGAGVPGAEAPKTAGQTGGSTVTTSVADGGATSEAQGADGATPDSIAEMGGAAREKAVKQLAKILVSMKTVDAGRILLELTDDEVESILRTLNVRQAAALLTVMPTERAALLSRRLLMPEREDK
jgi:hypothetical protein